MSAARALTMAGSGRKLPEDGGVWAWQVLRDREDYREAWAARAGCAAAPDLEPAPFPVRVQSEADLDAARWGLLAWEDPEAVDGPGSAFWSDAPMLGCALGEGEPALVDLLEEAGSTVTGLRLAGGALILKIERGPDAVQLRLADAAAFPGGGGIELRHGIAGLPVTAARELELWALAGEAAPPPGGEIGGRGT